MALTTEPRNDLHLTSTGVGHNYQESMKFPPDGFKVGMKKCRPKQAIEKKQIGYRVFFVLFQNGLTKKNLKNLFSSLGNFFLKFIFHQLLYISTSIRQTKCILTTEKRNDVD